MNNVSRIDSKMKGLIERTEVYLATLQEEQRRLRKEEIGYSSANSESFGLVEESCPVLETILEKHLAEGRKVTHQMRALMLAELKEKITYPFRKALNQALEDKHRLLKLVRESRESSSEVLRNVIRSKSETTEEPVENIHEEEDE